MVDRRQFLSSAAAISAYALSGARRLAAQGTQSIAGPDSLKAAAAGRGRLTGFAVNTSLLRSNENYRGLLKQQSSILVAENAMKWKPLRPSPTAFNFQDADMLANFARESGIALRGHNLCWHEALPDWFSSFVTKENAREVLSTHIRTVAGRYAGRIHSWDVVNEAVDPGSGRADGLRDSPWLQLAGPEYIDLAFRTAREADPRALLTYNDYGFEGEAPADAKKRSAILQLLRGMRERHVPLDAIGVQSHIKAGSTYGPELQQFLQECHGLGLKILVTELDVSDVRLPPDPAERDSRVATAYREYLEALLAEPGVVAVLMWGLDDGHTWLNGEKFRRADGLKQRPLLFDETYQPVPAFFAVRRALGRAH